MESYTGKGRGRVEGMDKATGQSGVCGRLL